MEENKEIVIPKEQEFGQKSTVRAHTNRAACIAFPYLYAVDAYDYDISLEAL